jgi:hypothetical protein
VVNWTSVRQHGDAGVPLAIQLDPDDEAPATTEPRSGGVQQIAATFNTDISSLQVPGAVVITGGLTPVSETLINHGRTLLIDVTGSADLGCYDIDLTGSVPGIIGDATCKVATLAGDTNDDQLVSSLDRAELKATSGQAAAVNPRVDVNSDGSVTSLDRALGKAKSGNGVTCP